MQQRQLRLGDVLDDYCPRERRLTNHAVVAMVGDEVKQTRCTTCDADHEYKHAKVPRPRKRTDALPALQGSAPVVLPRRPSSTVTSDGSSVQGDSADRSDSSAYESADIQAGFANASASGGGEGAGAAELDDRRGDQGDQGDQDDGDGDSAPLGDALPRAAGPGEGPAHRRLIRATLPRIEGQPPQVQRQAPDFTIRQPSGGARPGRFRSRPGRANDPFQGRSQGFDRHAGGHGGPHRHSDRQHPGRPPVKHQGSNRKRSK